MQLRGGRGGAERGGLLQFHRFSRRTTPNAVHFIGLARHSQNEIVLWQEFRIMPLALQILPDCCASASPLNCRTAVSAPSRRRQGRIQRGASPVTLSNVLANFPLSSFSSARVLTSHSVVDGPIAARTRCRTSTSSTDVEVTEDRRELAGKAEAVDSQNVDNRRTEMSKVAVLAGLVALQSCSPAFAESVGVEVARSSDSIGLITNMSNFQSGFSSAFLLIFFAEIGDKTFFIAALLAARKSNLAVFTGTFAALTAMTVISVTLGRAFHYLDNFIPNFGTGQFPWDDLAAVVLLVYFGVSTLVDAASMEGSKAEEEKQDAELAIAGVAGDGNVGFQAAASTVAATFALVFVAEWGDKSFFSTIALAAASSPAGVVTGAVAGHGVATVLAVLGGSFLSEYVSEKLIAYVGGVLFLVFAATTLVDILK